MADIITVRTAATGSTANVTGQSNRLALLPEAPTPLGATITATSARANNGFGDSRSRYVEVAFTATGSIDDLAGSTKLVLPRLIGRSSQSQNS